jgi:hypothetical protein
MGTASVVLQSGQGAYRLVIAGPSQSDANALTLTLALERADGIERIGLRCRISQELIGDGEQERLLSPLALWIEKDFEHTREAALKAIRSERKLLELSFDRENRGPF